MTTLVTHVSTTDHDRWDGPTRYIRVVIHDTTDELRRAAKRYRGEDFSNAGGCFHPADTVYTVLDDGTFRDDADPHWAGVLRLSREYLTTEVVAHECIHAAATIYRMDVVATVVLGNGCGHREETFSYIAGHLIARVCNALHDVGAW